MNKQQKQLLLQSITSFLMRAGSAGKSETEMKHYHEGFLQAVKVLFGEKAENEMREEIGEDFD